MEAILIKSTHGVYRAMVNEIKKSLNEQKKVTVIVPDYFSMSVQRGLLQSLDKECTFLLEVEPFKNLAKKALGDKEKRCLTKEGSVMLMADVIDKYKDELEYYSKSAGRDGFSKEFADAINTLRVSGLSIDDLFDAQDELPPSTAHKIHDLAFVYKKYLASLKEKYNDDSTMLDLYSQYLMQQEKDDRHDYFIMDFYYFSSVQYAILKGLEHVGGRVVLGLVHGFNNDNAKIYPANRILEKLGNLGIQVNVDKKKNKFYPLSDARNMVSKQLFSLKHVDEKVENDGAYAFYKANTVYDEILRVALDIKYKVMNENRRYQEFEIVCAQPKSYYNSLISIFKRLNIPFYIDQKSKLADQTFVRFLISMINIVSGNYKRVDVFDLVKNPLFVYIYGFNKERVEEVLPEDELDMKDIEPNTKYLDDIHQFENYVLKYNINYSLFKNTFDLVSFGEEELLQKAEDIRSFMCTLLNPLDEIGKKEVMISTIINVIKDICVNTDYAWSAHISAIKDVSNYYEKCAKQVNKKLDMIFDEIAIIMGDSMKTLSGFLDMFKTMIENVTIASVPVYRDSVYVGDMSSRFVGVGKIYIIGAAQEAFPAVERGGVIISDKDETNLEAAGLLISPNIKEKNYIQSLSAIEILKKSNETIDISYSCSVVGGHIKPSLVFQQINSFLCENGKEIKMNKIELEDIGDMKDEDKLKVYETMFSTPKSRYYSILKTLVPHRVVGDDNEKIYGSVYDTLLDADKDRIQGLFDDQDFIKNGALLLGEQDEDGSYKSSVSKIESFYKCPYAYYLKYGLGIKVRDDSQMQRNEAGSIIHKVLEIFIKDYYIPKKVKKSNLKKTAKLCFDAAIDDMPRYKNMVANEKKSLFQKLQLECEDICNSVFTSIENSNFKPIYAEKRFDKKDKVFKPITLKVGDKEINIVGQIDRVDKHGKDVFIVDYKTFKNADIDLTSLYYGTQIQLMMYLRSIEQNTSYNPVGAFYLPIYASYDKGDEGTRFKYTGVVLNDPNLHKDIDVNYTLETGADSMVPFRLNRSKIPSPEVFAQKQDLENWEEYAEMIAQKGLETIASGYVEAKPTDKECRVCQFADICKYKNTNSRKFAKAKLEVFEKIINGENKEEGGEDNE